MDLGTDRSERAGVNALSAADALFLIDDTYAVFIIGNRVNRARSLARTDQVGNGAIRARIGAHTAFLTFVRINLRSVVAH